MFLPHFVIICDLLTEQIHSNKESICKIYNKSTKKW